MLLQMLKITGNGDEKGWIVLQQIITLEPGGDYRAMEISSRHHFHLDCGVCQSSP